MPAVTNVVARPVSSSAIRVNWTYSTPACGSVDGFGLAYSRDGGTEVTRTVSDVSSRSVDITNLEGLQGTYTINMTALYQSVPSTPSGPVMVIFRGNGSFFARNVTVCSCVMYCGVRYRCSIVEWKMIIMVWYTLLDCIKLFQHIPLLPLLFFCPAQFPLHLVV